MHSVLTRRRVLVLYKNLCDATQASSQLCDQLLLFYDVLWVSCKSFVSSNGTINCSKNQLTIKELEKKKKNSTPKKSIASDKERQRRLWSTRKCHFSMGQQQAESKQNQTEWTATATKKRACDITYAPFELALQQQQQGRNWVYIVFGFLSLPSHKSKHWCVVPSCRFVVGISRASWSSNHVTFSSNAVNSIYFYGFRATIEEREEASTHECAERRGEKKIFWLLNWFARKIPNISAFCLAERSFCCKSARTNTPQKEIASFLFIKHFVVTLSVHWMKYCVFSAFVVTFLVSFFCTGELWLWGFFSQVNTTFIVPPSFSFWLSKRKKILHFISAVGN